MLNREDIIRYHRQILFPDFGKKGQLKLKNSHVVVAGVGGLGSPTSLYLAAAGVGHITIVDSDRVELSNLNRQVLHWDKDIGKRKVTSAKRKLSKVNHSIEITPIFEKITEKNEESIIKGARVVVDGMDNLETRFILNAGCIKEKIPFIHGAINGLFGEITTIIPGKTPCYACIYPEMPELEKPFPVFGATPALIASLQVMETIKLIAGLGGLLTGRMLFVNGSSMEFNSIELKRNPRCRVCSR